LIQLYTSNKITEYEFALNSQFNQLIARFEKELQDYDGLGNYYKELKEMQGESKLFDDFEQFLSSTEILKNKSNELITNKINNL
jgi:hypothetical protein